MLRSNMLRDHARKRKLAERLFPVTHGEGLNRLAADLGGQCRHRARIEAATEKHAQRHVTHQMARDTFLQQPTIPIDIVLPRLAAIVGLHREVPVQRDFQLAAFSQLERVPGQQLPDSRIHRLCLGDVAERQVLRERAAIELRIYLGMGEDRLDLRSKQQDLPVIPVIQRLYAQPVARNKKLAFAAVPDRKRVHAAQVLHAIASVLLKQVDDGFGVAPGAIAVSARLEIFAQILMVVQFSVVNDPEIFVFVRDGLMSGLNIDDAQPPHGKSDIRLHEEAIIVRPAVNDALVHFRQRVALDSPRPVAMKNSANSAHDLNAYPLVIVLGTAQLRFYTVQRSIELHSLGIGRKQVILACGPHNFSIFYRVWAREHPQTSDFSVASATQYQQSLLPSSVQ